jgi:hypothetical protein
MFIAPLFVQVSSLLFHNFCNPQVQSLDNHNICKPKLQTGLATQQLCGHCKKLAMIQNTSVLYIFVVSPSQAQ